MALLVLPLLRNAKHPNPEDDLFAQPGSEPARARDSIAPHAVMSRATSKRTGPGIKQNVNRSRDVWPGAPAMGRGFVQRNQVGVGTTSSITSRSKSVRICSRHQMLGD